MISEKTRSKGDKRRVVILGASGQLGSDLVGIMSSEVDFEAVALSHEQVDCTREESVRAALARTRPSVVINCAAFVRVDECEDRPQVAFEVNAIGALHVARACAQSNALCVYVSTDYVFDGSQCAPYVESDAPSPINVYGTSKLAGEQLVRQAAPRWLIVRMASLFGKSGARAKGGNFVETILARAAAGESLRIVTDIRMSPTYARDGCEALSWLVKNDATGLFHVANLGSCSWYEFGKKILEYVGLDIAIEPVTVITHPTRARRPANSALASERAGSFLPQKLRSWDEALQAYLLETGHLAQLGKSH